MDMYKVIEGYYNVRLKNATYVLLNEKINKCFRVKINTETEPIHI